jgi:folate-binding protein YgfZ
MPSLPLQNHFQNQNIPLLTLNNWQLPAHFGDPEAEYNATQQSVALFDSSFLTIVSGKGKDHLEYLNRRTSQRFIDLEIGQVLRTCQLNAEGKMEADYLLLRTGEAETLSIAPPAITGDYLVGLNEKYIFAEDASFTNETEKWAAFTLLGPKAEEALSKLGDVTLPENGEATFHTIGDTKVILLSIVYTGKGLTILLPAEKAGEIYLPLQKAVHSLNGKELGFLAFDSLRVEAGIPWWGIDVSQLSIPLDADLTDAIHTNKGCYPGQETIAKILNLGHPARQLVGVVWDTEDPLPSNSAIIVNGQEAGRLTSSTFSPRLNRAIGLAMMRWQHRTPGTEVQSEGEICGKLVELPFKGLRAEG